MPELIYLLCAMTSLICAWLLLRSYRRTRFPLLFWSGLCFSALALNNLLLVLDKLVFPDINFSIVRVSLALLALLLLLFGLIWQDD
ncbi:MAG: DUF5985 family protein [Polaromonas sp.]|uniref:DUF5985 family protein n=1 Tax=Polaromonas sp. TaxID=1869339 RepID=UPI004036A479